MNTTPQTTDRLGRIRAFRERQSYPTALCRTCGSLVKTGDGVRDDEGLSGLTSGAAAVIDTLRAKQGLPALDGWRRAHEACDSLDYAGVLARITGLDVTHEVAEAALGATRLAVLAWRQAPIARDGAVPDFRGG